MATTRLLAVLTLAIALVRPLVGQGTLDWSKCAPPDVEPKLEWPPESLAPRMDSMIRLMSERLERFRGGVVWPGSADSIDVGPLLHTDSVALVHALAYLAADDAMADANTAFLSAYLYRRISGAPGPLFEALTHAGNDDRRAQAALALRPPLDPVTEAIVAGFVCDASWQVVHFNTGGRSYWNRRPPPPFYSGARFTIMKGWEVLGPATRMRLRSFVQTALPEDYDQFLGRDQ